MAENVTSNMTRDQKVLLALMAIMSFATFITYSVIAPFFPVVAKEKGASESEIGLIFGMYFLGAMVTCAVVGNFVSQIGVKFVYIAGMVSRAIAEILFGLLIYAPDGKIFVAMCFICRFFESVGAGSFMTAMYAVVSREYPQNVAQVFGFLQTFNGIGLMMGPPVGGVLYDLGGFVFPFLVLGGSMLIVSAISYFVMPNFHDEISEKSEGKPWLFSLLKNPHTVLNMLGVNLVYGPICFLEISLQEHLMPFNISPSLVGLVFTCETGSYSIFSFFWGTLNNTIFYPKLQMAFGAIVYGLAYMFVGPSPILGNIPKQLWLIIISLVGVGIGASAISSVTFKDTLARALDDGHPSNFHTFGLVSGLYMFAVTFGAFVGPTLGSIVSEQSGFPVAAWYFAIVMFSTAGAVVIFQMFSLFFGKRRDSREKVPLQVTDGTPLLGDGLERSKEMRKRSSSLLSHTTSVTTI